MKNVEKVEEKRKRLNERTNELVKHFGLEQTSQAPPDETHQIDEQPTNQANVEPEIIQAPPVPGRKITAADRARRSSGPGPGAAPLSFEDPGPEVNPPDITSAADPPADDQHQVIVKNELAGMKGEEAKADQVPLAMASFEPSPAGSVSIPAPPVVTPAIIIQATPTPADFPRDAIGGLAGEFADLMSQHLESPWTFFANNFLTCLGSIMADRITFKSAIDPEPRFYTVNIGASADDRKSESIKRTVRFFETTLGKTFKPCFGVGSAEGLARVLKVNPNTILIFDELKTFVSKSSLDGAVLADTVGSLFEDTIYENPTRSQTVAFKNAHLSLLSACTVETFARMWTPGFFDLGFINRLWLVKDYGKRRFSIPPEIPEDKVEPLRIKLRDLVKSIPENKIRIPIDEDALALFQEWYLSVESSIFSKRLDGYGHRLMILLTVNNGQARITRDIISRVISLLRWQLEIRRDLDPVNAESSIARMEEMIIRTLSREPMAKRDLQRKVHSNRSGFFVWNCAIQNLDKDERIYFDNKNQLYRLVSDRRN